MCTDEDQRAATARRVLFWVHGLGCCYGRAGESETEWEGGQEGWFHGAVLTPPPQEDRQSEIFLINSNASELTFMKEGWGGRRGRGGRAGGVSSARLCLLVVLEN